jgi:hypothetical protein
MNPDIITSAPRPQPLQPPSRAHAGEPLVRAQPSASSVPTQPTAPAQLARAARRASLLRTTLESLARSLIVSIASAPPLRRIESFVDRHLAADEASRRETETASCARVLRVRARLTAGEQRVFDELLRDEAIEPLLATIIRRGEDEALELVRRQLGAFEPAVSAASLARQIGRIRGHLTSEEYDRIIMRLPHLSSDEQQTLHSHLRALTPADAAMLLRSHLRPVRH